MGVIIFSFIVFIFLSAKDGDETASKIKNAILVIVLILILINEFYRLN